MAKKVEAWEDASGRLHHTEQLAKREDAETEIFDALEAIIDKDGYPQNSASLSDLLCTNVKKLLPLLQAFSDTGKAR